MTVTAESHRYLVTDDAVAGYADAVGLKDLSYSGATGHLPGAFAFLWGWDALCTALADLPLSASVAAVHVRQQLTHFRTPRTGEEVTSAAAVEAKSGSTTTVVVDSWDTDGVPVSRGVTSVVLKGAAPRPGVLSHMSPASCRSTHEAWSCTALWSTTRADSRRYADTSGDRNPIHLEGTAAEAVGFPGLILHGMHVVGAACGLVERVALGSQTGRIVGLDMRFGSYALPDETLAFRIALCDFRGDHAHVTCRSERGPVLKHGTVVFTGASPIDPYRGFCECTAQPWT